MTAKHSLWLSTLVCLLGGMFYLYEFTLQVSPGVMTHELMRDLQLNAAGLGAMSAFYYYAYTPMQLPAGLLYDRFGPRRLIAAAILLCSAGALFFSMTKGVALASLGRFLMGIGSAFSYIGALLLVSRWFPPRSFAALAGVIGFMSSMGAIAGEAPLAAAIAHWGWRPTIASIAFFGVFLALLVYWIVRDHPPGHDQNQQILTQPGELKRLHAVCTNRQTWLMALYSFTVWAPMVAFALWGVPFLEKAYGLSTHTASLACSMMWLGMGVGGPFVGWWSDYIGKRCVPLTTCSLIGFVSVIIITYLPNLNLTLLFILMFTFGVASSDINVAFAVVKENNSYDRVGTAIGFNNMATVAGGALFQPLVGILLTLHSGETVKVAGVPVYALSDYRFAMAVVPICYLLSAIISMFLVRETHCQSVYH